MRKFLRCAVILVLMLCMGLVLGCGEDKSLSSLSISISEDYATLSYTGAVPTYSVQISSGRIPLNISTTPASFAVRDLTFTTSAENICYITGDGYLVTRAEGSATLRASYRDKNGKTTAFTFKVNVITTPVPKFALTSYALTYNGTDQKDDAHLKVDTESEDYTYSYLYFAGGAQIATDSIKDAGEYTIKYCKRDDENFVIAQMSLSVAKANLTLNAQSTQSTYLTSLGEGFYYGEATTLDHEIVSSVGADTGRVIGRYSFVTSATATAYCGQYDTNVQYSIDADYAGNYNIHTTRGTHTITPLSAILVMDEYNGLYGENIEKNRFTLYDDSLWQEPFVPSPTTPTLNKSYLISKMDISMQDYSLSVDGNEVQKNSFGYYDVLPTGESYDLGVKGLATSPNLIITHIVPTKATIEAQTVNIDILTATHGKKHLERDDLSSISLNLGSQERFKREIVSSVEIDYKGVYYGEGAIMAPAGEYYYKLTSTPSNNFNLSLTERCQEGYVGDDKVSYVISPAEVEAQFSYLSDYYKDTLPTAGYYGEKAYTLTLRTFSVNGTSLLEDKYKDAEFENNGYFVLSSPDCNIEEKIRANVTLSEIATTAYKTYAVGKSLESYSASYSGNFTLKGDTSSLIELKRVDLYYYVGTDYATATFSGLGENAPSVSEFLSDIHIKDSDVDIEDIVEDVSSLLSLSFKKGSSRVYKVRQDGSSSFVETDTFGNAGHYLVTENIDSSVVYKTGMEYYNLILDRSREYYFTIEKLPITIVPEAGDKDTKVNCKIYGSADGDITYSVMEEMPAGEDPRNLQGATSLSRDSGENVKTGGYRIKLGNLSFRNDSTGFDNYILSLDEEPKYYLITPRTIIVRPYDTSLIYGSSYPVRTITSSDYEVKVKLDDNTLMPATSSQLYVSCPTLRLPSIAQFEGEFKLSKDRTNIAEKIGGVYPVFIEGGDVSSYYIILGGDEGFRYVGLTEGGVTYYNYEIAEDVDDMPRCLISRREAVVSFVTEGRDNLEGLERDGDIFNLSFDSNTSSGKYSISNVLLDVTFTQLDIRASISDDGSLIYVDSIGDISFTLMAGEVDVTQFYSYKISSKKIYNIASEVISIQLLHDGSNAVTAVYDGTDKSGMFSLAITSANSDRFEIDSMRSQLLLKDGIIFTNAKGESGTSAVEADSYIVSLSLNEEKPLVIALGDSFLTFTSYTTKVKGYVLDFSTLSSLTIEKATITTPSEITFDGPFIYGMGREGQPNLSLSIEGEPVFVGVDGAPLRLFVREGINYEVMNNVNISYFPVGSQMVRLRLSVARYIDSSGAVVDITGMTDDEISALNQVIDSNYIPLEIDVNIDVEKRPIYVKDYSLMVDKQVRDSSIYSTIYNGRGVMAGVDVSAVVKNASGEEMPSSSYSVRTDVFRLASRFNEAEVQIECYGYDSTTEEVGEEPTYISATYLSEIKSVKRLGSLMIINDVYAAHYSSASNLSDSGVYIVVPTVSALDNFIFSTEDGETYSSFLAHYLVDISRNADYIKFYSKDNPLFYFGEQFFPNNRAETIAKFGISLSQNFYDNLEFSITGGSASDGTLPIGTYSLNCTISSLDNYYFKQSVSFTVKKCRAVIGEIVSKAFTYTGEEIDDFLRELYVTTFDYLGNGTTWRYVDMSEERRGKFTFRYDPELSEGTYAKDVCEYGKYYHLYIQYADDDYETETEYEYVYRILPTPYDGEIVCYTTTIDYEPTMSFADLYSLLRGRITIDRREEEIEGVDIFYGTAQDEKSEENCTLLTIDSMTEEARAGRTDEEIETDLMRIIMRINQNGKITYKVKFTDETIANVYKDTDFIVRTKVISDSTFSLDSTELSVRYTGSAQYQGIRFSTIDLSPYSATEQVLSGRKYTIETEKSLNTYIYTVVLKDNLDNEVVSVTYTYVNARTGTSASPITPDLYRVSYKIDAGINYSTSKTLQDREYSISPADRLNFSVSTRDIDYTGEDLLSSINYDDYRDFKNGNNFVQITGTNEDGRDIRFSVEQRKNNDGPLSSSYTAFNGVSLFLGFKAKGSDTFISEIIDAGEYVLYVYFNHHSTYLPYNHFNSVVFNSSSLVISSSDLQGEYVCSVPFIVNKAEEVVNTDNIRDYIEGEFEVAYNDTLSCDVIYIDSTESFTIIDGEEFSLRLHYMTVDGGIGPVVAGFEENGFNGLSHDTDEVMFYLYVVPLSLNKYSSSPVIVVVNFAN